MSTRLAFLCLSAALLSLCACNETVSPSSADGAAPGADATAGGFDATAPGDDAATAPGDDAATAPGDDAATAVPDATSPGLDAGTPGLDASSPGLDAGTPGADASVSPSCGDQNVDYAAGEQCDDGMKCDDGTTPCATAAACGSGACLPRSGDGCSATCTIEAVSTCGNGVVDLATGEQCDPDKTCGDLSTVCVVDADCIGTSGSPTCAVRARNGCTAACRFEAVGQTCGDTVKDLAEACDLGAARNGDTCNLGGCACGTGTPCACNATCNLTATTSLFAGSAGSSGRADGDRLTAARFGGNTMLAATTTHLYVADAQSNTVRRVDLASGVVSTIAGDAAGGAQGYVDSTDGLSARFRSPQAITTDGATLWIADEGNHVVRAVDLASATFAVTTVAGQQWAGAANAACPDTTQRAADHCYADSATASTALFHGLRGLTYHAGKLWLLDENAATLRTIVPGGSVATVAGTAYQNTASVDGIGAAGRMISPRYIASDGSGMLYIADTNGNVVRSFNTVTGMLGTFVGSGTQGYQDGVGTAAQVHRPRGMTSDGTSLYWVEFNANTLRQADFATRRVTTLVGTPAVTTCPRPSPSYAEGAGNAAILNCPFSVTYHHPTRSLFFDDGSNFVIRQVK